jgi:hypothetical protein
MLFRTPLSLRLVKEQAYWLGPGYSVYNGRGTSVTPVPHKAFFFPAAVLLIAQIIRNAVTDTGCRLLYHRRD